MMWRQGDVFMAAVDTIPAGATARPHCVLAEGELTGHSHRIDQPGVARLYEHGGSLYLEVTAASATVVHQEHKPITLLRGCYRVWGQREYSPEAIRAVRD
jgi:hypothetical protein